MDPMIVASGISALANIGGGFMSAGSAAANNAQQLALQQQQQNFQNNVNNATWEHDQAMAQYNWGNQQLQNQYNWNAMTTAQGFNASEAQKNRDWQEYMGNTSYQRAMSSMKAAGLNPILAYQQGGAPVPSGATASSPMASGGVPSGSSHAGAGSSLSYNPQNTGAEMARGISQAVNSAVDTAKTYQGVELMKKQAELTGEQTTRVGFERGNLDADTQRKHAEEDLLHRQELTERQRADLVKAQADAARASSASNYADAAFRMGQNAEAKKYGYGVGPQLHERFSRQLEDFGQTLTHQMYGP